MNDEIHRNYESETGHAYERPPIVPQAGMSAGYWRLMLVIGIVAALLYFVATRM